MRELELGKRINPKDVTLSATYAISPCLYISRVQKKHLQKTGSNIRMAMTLKQIHTKALNDAASANTDEEIEKVRKNTLEALGDRMENEEVLIMFSDVFGLLARSESTAK